MDTDEEDFEVFGETSSLLSKLLRRGAGCSVSVSALNRLLELEEGDEEEVRACQETAKLELERGRYAV